MLAILYIGLFWLLGDAVCRRFLPFASTIHRCAVAFLVGLLLSSWLTYLAGLCFAGTTSPLFWGNIVFFVTCACVIWLLLYGPLKTDNELPGVSFRLGEKWDWIFAVGFMVVTSWMCFSTFNMNGGTLQIGHHEFPDFGATVSIMQSFAEGHNFPTEYPQFAGERLRTYFLFYFQAGNLEYLGLNPAFSNNILSILSTVSLLSLVMTLGRVLFGSVAAGRIGGVLFFFHGSLSFIPFLWSQTSFAALFDKLTTMKAFLGSGLPLRGEDWGVWSQNVFLTQRNLTSAIGLLLVVLIFLLMRYRDSTGVTERIAAKQSGTSVSALNADGPNIFCGVLLGLMVIWNGAVLFAGIVVLIAMWILFRRSRETLVILGVTAVLAIPQIVYIKLGARPGEFSYLHWAYLFDDPSILMVLFYILFIFGFKWVAVGLGIYYTGRLQRLFLLAVSVLLVLTFTTRFTEELLANHRYVNIWLIIANVYAGYGLVRLWELIFAGSHIPARVAAVVLTMLITIGGIFDLMPIRNGHYFEMPYNGDPLVEWVRANTDPKAVFLTDRFMNHQILLAGRRVFFGAQYYAWEAGNDTTKREAVYKRMFESADWNEVSRLLNEHNVKYVAIDDAIRSGRGFIKQSNEQLYANNSKLVFEDREKRYGGLKVYEVGKVTAPR